MVKFLKSKRKGVSKMPRIEINGRVHEIPESAVRQLLESQGRGYTRNSYPIARQDEYHIQPYNTGISDAEIQNELGDTEGMDLNEGRNAIKEATYM